jgi:hypothetical protein
MAPREQPDEDDPRQKGLIPFERLPAMHESPERPDETWEGLIEPRRKSDESTTCHYSLLVLPLGLEPKTTGLAPVMLPITP